MSRRVDPLGAHSCRHRSRILKLSLARGVAGEDGCLDAPLVTAT